MSSKCELTLITVLDELDDTYQFILAYGEVIRGSALHVYKSALPFTPLRYTKYIAKKQTIPSAYSNAWSLSGRRI
jgi:hypothetical protein